MLIHQILDETVSRLPEKLAILTKHQSISYGTLREYSLKLAYWLKDQGVDSGDRIIFILPNDIPLVALTLACSRIGAVFIILNEETQKVNLDYILLDAEPFLFITTKKLGKKFTNVENQAGFHMVEDIWHQVSKGAVPHLQSIRLDEGAAASFIYTSGSTGKPKAVVSSQRNVCFSVKAIQQCLNYKEQDVVGNFLPLSFDYGLYQLFLTFNVGATIALGPATDIGPYFIQVLSNWGITCLPALPSMFHILLTLGKRDPTALGKLRLISNTGAKLPQNYVVDMKSLLPECKIYLMYGLTECKRVSILDSKHLSSRVNSVGQPIPGTECYIVDGQDNVLPAGEVGQLIVKGPNVTLGYWNAPELTKRNFREWNTGGEKVLYTGDLFSMDEDGFLYFHGRNDDIYKQNGFRISAIEVEQAASNILGVSRALVIPPTETEKAATLVVTTKLSVENVRRELQELLEEYKLPSLIMKMNTFPVTANGKYDKNSIRMMVKGMPT
jgi:acyl-coenzyme A synthetase/AMP-(fatty) acid ligase